MTKKIVPTIVMKKADADKWLKALRSGKYRQGVGTLVKEKYDYDKNGKEIEVNAYCCLGVMQNELANGKVQDCDLPTSKWYKKYGIQITQPPASIGDEHKDILLDPPVRAKNGIQYDTVSELNDSGNYSFKRIANILEKRIKKV